MPQHSLTSEAQAGYAAASEDAPYLFSSSVWMAWQAGRELARRGLPSPKAARQSRGYSVKLLTEGGAEVLIVFQGQALDTLTLTQKDRANG